MPKARPQWIVQLFRDMSPPPSLSTMTATYCLEAGVNRIQISQLAATINREKQRYLAVNRSVRRRPRASPANVANATTLDRGRPAEDCPSWSV